jgi:hypothetical protein
MVIGNAKVIDTIKAAAFKGRCSFLQNPPKTHYKRHKKPSKPHPRAV